MASRSELLRFQDVRDAYRLIGECRDLGSDPALWQTRLFEGLCGLIGVTVVAGGEAAFAHAEREIKPISGFTTGSDDKGRQLFNEFVREIGVAGCPFLCALGKVPGTVVTRTRAQLVSDRVWYRSRSFEYRRMAHLENQLASFCWTTPGACVSGITLNRAPGEPEFTPRQQRLLNFVHVELGPLIGRALVSATEPTADQLSPRLRQTLACLLEGDSEKQIAARLGLSYPTIHQYVTALYRYYKVRSRGQLLAHVMRRMASGHWRLRAVGTHEKP